MVQINIYLIAINIYLNLLKYLIDVPVKLIKNYSSGCVFRFFPPSFQFIFQFLFDQSEG